MKNNKIKFQLNKKYGLYSTDTANNFASQILLFTSPFHPKIPNIIKISE